jgi:hypothetical protein
MQGKRFKAADKAVLPRPVPLRRGVIQKGPPPELILPFSEITPGTAPPERAYHRNQSVPEQGQTEDQNQIKNPQAIIPPL